MLKFKSEKISQGKRKKEEKDAPSPETMAVARDLKKKIALSVILLPIYILVMPLVGFALSNWILMQWPAPLEWQGHSPPASGPLLPTAP